MSFTLTTLKEAINEAMRDWVTNVRNTHYVLGSALGSHPYPRMVRDFHSIIGRETKEQILEAKGRLPDEMVACVGGGRCVFRRNHYIRLRLFADQLGSFMPAHVYIITR